VSPRVVSDGSFDDAGSGDISDDATPDVAPPIDTSDPAIDASRPDIDPSESAYCTRSSSCYVYASDCCLSDCTANLVLMSGVEVRGYFQSCMARGCTPCVVGPQWIPRCIDNRCAIVDLDSSAFSACGVDADCELRWGTRCCDPCRPNPDTDLVSTARTAIFCAPDDFCDPCAPRPFPAGATAVCISGRCKVTYR
jgi:hypothetical protein